MMPGVAAQPLGRHSSGGGGITNSWSFNFLDEVYTKNASPVVLADQIDKPERVGASGLEILDNDVDGVVSAIGDFLTDWLALDWKARFVYEEVADVATTYLLWMAEPVDFHSVAIRRLSAFASNVMRAEDAGLISRTVTNSGPFTAGVHTVEVTRTNGLISIRTDGGTTDTDLTPNATLNALMTASFGGDPTDQSYNGCFIRSIELSPP